MANSALAPGFRFTPTDVELLKYYLQRKVLGKRFRVKVIAELDIYKFEPWDLPDKSCWESGDLKWYFFCPREKKYQSGSRIKRATEGGYWKVTGKDRSVLHIGEVVGWIKTLIFHTGRAPQGDRTDWVMHEYRLEDQRLADKGVTLDSYVLCVVFQKEGLGPRIGAQYGAAFNEEDWSDDDIEINSKAVQDAKIRLPHIGQVCNYDNQAATNTHTCENTAVGPSGSCISNILSPCSKFLQPVCSNYVTVEKPHASDGCDIQSKAISSANRSDPDLVLLSSNNGLTSTTTCFPEGRGMSPYESCVSDVAQPPHNVLQLDSGNHATLVKPLLSNGDDIRSRFNCSTGESNLYKYKDRNNEVCCLEAVPNANTPELDLLLPNKCNNSIATSSHSPFVMGLQEHNQFNCFGKADDLVHLGNAGDSRSMFEDLGDLGSLSRVGDCGHNLFSECTSLGNFLELDDLEHQGLHGDVFDFK